MPLHERPVTASAPLIDDVEPLVTLPRSVRGIPAPTPDKRPVFRGSGGVPAAPLAFLVAGATVVALSSQQHQAMVCEFGPEPARTVRRGVRGLSPRYGTHTTTNASRLRSIQDSSRVLRTALRDYRSGLSGRLVQSVGKCVHVGDRVGSAA
jgi:hypothetical protein